VKFINKEHLYYYKIYREVIGEIPEPKKGQNSCPGCGTGIGKGNFHCKICGYVLNWRV
jgi:asparagine synthase (glutamine-hydrolysing)